MRIPGDIICRVRMPVLPETMCMPVHETDKDSRASTRGYRIPAGVIKHAHTSVALHAAFTASRPLLNNLDSVISNVVLSTLNAADSAFSGLHEADPIVDRSAQLEDDTRWLRELPTGCRPSLDVILSGISENVRLQTWEVAELRLNSSESKPEVSLRRSCGASPRKVQDTTMLQHRDTLPLAQPVTGKQPVCTLMRHCEDHATRWSTTCDQKSGNVTLNSEVDGKAIAQYTQAASCDQGSASALCQLAIADSNFALDLYAKVILQMAGTP